MAIRHALSIQPSFARQRGAALFISLMILILMTLIGLAAMRTTTLQERMSGNYRQQNLTFQAAESRVRGGEGEILQYVNRTLLSVALQDPVAAGSAAPWSGWESGFPGADASVYEVLDKSMGFGNIEPGGPQMPDFYRVSALAVQGAVETDRASTVAAVQTVYVP